MNEGTRMDATPYGEEERREGTSKKTCDLRMQHIYRTTNHIM
jgi:hypothetical protein